MGVLWGSGELMSHVEPRCRCPGEVEGVQVSGSLPAATAPEPGEHPVAALDVPEVLASLVHPARPGAAPAVGLGGKQGKPGGI